MNLIIIIINNSSLLMTNEQKIQSTTHARQKEEGKKELTRKGCSLNEKVYERRFRLADFPFVKRRQHNLFLPHLTHSIWLCLSSLSSHQLPFTLFSLIQ